jgi:mRNA interferase MazF
MGAKIKQYDVFWVNLDPVEGSEMAKKRPCVIISPNEMNDYLRTVTIAPLTSNLTSVNWRVNVFFSQQNGMVALDHIRSISKTRLDSYMGRLQTSEIQNMKQIMSPLRKVIKKNN